MPMIRFGCIQTPKTKKCACQWVPCIINGIHKPLFSAKFSLKMGLTALFTHLEIILLHYFQFLAISSIQTDLK